MKRWIALLLAAILLVGCGKQEPVAESAPSTEAPTTQPSTEAPTTEATEPPTTEPVEETTEPIPTEPGQIYYHPLTGQALDGPFSGRVMAVVINNIQSCQPQHGISKADIFYELETEGGITRNLALYTNLEDAGTIGPVRSLRTYFAALALSYDAPIAHCSGSKVVRAGYADNYANKLPTFQKLDANGNGSSYFYRDQSRLNQGYSSEHTLFTSGEKLLKAMEAKNYNKTYPDGLDLGLQFADIPQWEGAEASRVIVDFYGNKTTTFTFDTEKGLYSMSQYGGDHKDGNTGKTVTFRNVMTLYTHQQKVDVDNEVRSFYTLLGSGEGHLACDGKIIPIRWQHDSYNEPFTYTLEDGTPLTLGVGKTYIAITSTGPVEVK